MVKSVFLLFKPYFHNDRMRQKLYKKHLRANNKAVDRNLLFALCIAVRLCDNVLCLVNFIKVSYSV
jgi:hypothetical protein